MPFSEAQLSPEYATTSRSVELAKQIESSTDLNEAKVLLKEFLESLKNELTISLSPDVSELYKEMQQEHQLARLESISKVFESIVEHHPLHLGEPEQKYPNAVIPEKEGLQIAFAEGEAPGPIRFVVGFDVKGVIGFDPSGLQVSEIEIEENDPRDQQLRLQFCKHVSGDLEPEKIKTFILRTPRSLFPTELLTEEEKRNKLQFIFRGGHIPNI